ncbi:beta-glucan synthesis-associated [Vararia minispora EC-137]|uniref:Beta-glucan synthesis-associated n=1 Tax=Vararia minispora EC-137 TaxID=1314806 RepID=A0ACB8QET2_9AGAM|nr:beta-glucan synthesis-associated [Vararia minispora EC-137]
MALLHRTRPHSTLLLPLTTSRYWHAAPHLVQLSIPLSPPSLLSAVMSTEQPEQHEPYRSFDSPNSASVLAVNPELHPPLASTPYAAFLRSTSSASAASLISSASVYALDPLEWANVNDPEADDVLHNPSPRRDKKHGTGGALFNTRAFVNLGCMGFVVIGILALFAGYPMISYFTRSTPSSQGAFGVGGINASGQIPTVFNDRGLIDIDTPEEAKTRVSWTDPSKTYQLVFSDEFNTDGRSFYPGDDPYWEALDLYYWQTVDLEWYDPAAVTTKNGALEITLSDKQQHNLNYTGGMLTSWNKFCFTGGIVEAAVSLPGSPIISGLWPAVWTMGNLGRVGYGATTDGLWPYSYDACDYGTVPNQTIGSQPPDAFIPGMGDPYNGDHLSFLPGQRLSRCTCPGQSHPGPMHSDKTYVGRAAPEIDLFEAAASPSGGNLSQSAQFAPFNFNYYYYNGTGNYTIYDYNVTAINGYHGGAYQQAVSGLSIANQSCYELADRCFSVYGIEYKPGFDNSYITWVSNDKPTWTVFESAFAADPRVGINRRPISQEPMYIILNLGISKSFIRVDFSSLTFPAKMRVDYVRVYQPSDSINWGCDPVDFPTMDYINTYMDAYTNPNYTRWTDIGQEFPKNSFLGQC